MKRLLWWLIAGSKGGENRGRIILSLKDRPYNTNQLSEELGLDYKTVQHHLKVLKNNNIIESPRGKQYGSMFFITEIMEKHYDIFKEIWGQIGKKNLKK